LAYHLHHEIVPQSQHLAKVAFHSEKTAQIRCLRVGKIADGIRRQPNSSA
jgi:hypothetical protein